VLGLQRGDDAGNVKNSVGVFECGFDVLGVAYVASHIRDSGMLDNGKQHIEDNNTILLGF
jgi:hypothetical protein